VYVGAVQSFDLAKMRRACSSAALTLREVGALVRPGTSTGALDRLARAHTTAQGGVPAPFNYHGFPKNCCTSVNDVVCHGIPSEGCILTDGDIINIDVTTILDGHFGDCSATFYVGTPSPEARRLVELTQRALKTAVGIVGPGVRLGAVGAAIEALATAEGFTVVREFGGHGIGTLFHTLPHVNHWACGDRTVLKVGDVFTIEPMLCLGARDVYVEADGWTVQTCDKSWSAQFEHTVLVTDDGCEVLTVCRA
jgi:methionyl aminopeptidase